MLFDNLSVNLLMKMFYLTLNFYCDGCSSYIHMYVHKLLYRDILFQIKNCLIIPLFPNSTLEARGISFLPKTVPVLKKIYEFDITSANSV